MPREVILSEPKEFCLIYVVLSFFLRKWEFEFLSSLGSTMGSWLMVVRSGFYNFDGLVSSRMSFGFIS